MTGHARTVAGCLLAGVVLLTAALTEGSASAIPAGRAAHAGHVAVHGDVPAVVRSERTFFAASPIEHVVIVYQENHSFDDVLGAVCRFRRTPCAGHTGGVTFADGRHARNQPEPDIVPEVAHNPPAQTLALHNRWDKLRGCGPPAYACVTHLPRTAIPNLARLADHFVVSDRTFASGRAASFGAHVTLASGTLDGFLGWNPIRSQTPGVRSGKGWGCTSDHDVWWAASGRAETLVPSCVPDRRGNGPYRASPVPYVPTIMQRVEQAGKTWHIYQGSPAAAPDGQIWAVCTYYYWCTENRFTPTYDSSTSDFYEAARAGALPSLSLLMPVANTSQHNQRSMKIGDNYIGHVIASVENGPDWTSTAIFITYDDCGCFYDHVRPPAGLGTRAPMVIVSPYARAGATDSHQAVLPFSMLSFVEHNFGLRPLSPRVTKAYDYRNSFDFGQTPIPGIPMTRSGISTAERARLARMPSLEDDPT